ncbi:MULTISPECIES: Fe(3+)-hydroxamate ABC transporter permease FhuB [Glaesserella]|uniref:Fe(3+)-hydroxamate ABC transporter permease FhuB n=1 Tax=Glaesserella australis TaxID=2094024 RepID=A0A328C352_9PAST|nr:MULTISPECIES: Fe(3+)-hydroxamate ABC transporter permease FhuB [Glaesserella]AUI66974.1 Fe(3+)-hydroxamate ABC transporter permease FhuB [Glaesserella sp. 15-184]RAL18934.1 Fe(3+)-hydroxamate ABC transporter permease FhuB [Glaesserella australis]
MVARPLMLFMLLAGSVVGLTAWLLGLQLPENQALFSLFQPSEQLDILLIQSYTLPRIAVALLAGGMLGLASLLLQQVMANPLASDNTLGISAGSQFALFITAIFVPNWLEISASAIALLGAGLSLLLVLTLAMRKTMSPLLLILAGLVVNLYFGSFSALMMLFYPEEARGLAQWGAGSLTQESWRDTHFLAIQAVICGGIIAMLLRPLTILSLNDSNAQSLGVPVNRLRFLGVLISAYLISAVVSCVGMLGFIGLASATTVRQLGVRMLKWQLLASFACGALLLALTDLLLQLLAHFKGINLPTGAVTALLGTPLLLWLMFRSLANTGRLTEQSPAVTRRFRLPTLWLLIVALLLVLWLALSLGRSASGWILLEFNDFYAPLVELRYPRILTALAVGILLAVAGVLLQRLALNPMASPELLGVSSGTSMGILAVLFLSSTAQTSLFWLAGIAGALIALLVLTAINQRNGMLPEKVLLTGISLSALFDTLQRMAIASGDPRANQLIAWTSGSTQQITVDLAVPFFCGSLVLLALSLLFSRWLELLALQAPVAQALGLNLKRTRWILILFTALLTALATLIIGPLSFIGLLVPHISRFLGVHRAKSQILISALLGGLIMVFADWLGRQMLFPYEVPAGLVATLIGGTYFLLMVRRV